VIVYHGTTSIRARRIIEEGFRPMKPSRRVWFAQSYGYARGRAQAQAFRANDRPVVLSCEVDVAELRSNLGAKRVLATGGVICVDAPVSVTIVAAGGQVRCGGVQSSSLEPTTPADLARWLNEALGLRPWKGVRPRNSGVVRLSKWVINRVAERHGKYSSTRELFEMARRFLPEVLKGCEFDEQRAHIRRIEHVGKVTAQVGVEPSEPDPDEARIIECLESAKPRRRVRGLEILREREDSDLFDWCMMFMNDPAPQVRVASARLMATCPYIDPEILIPLVDSKDRLLRAAAVGTLASHLGKDEPEWLDLGLRDPAAHVRLAAAEQLRVLDRVKHRAIFDLALNDPNPKVEQLARKVLHPQGKPARRTPPRTPRHDQTGA
jgi:hypothetical protein